jgi:hypothetical protein
MQLYIDEDSDNLIIAAYCREIKQWFNIHNSYYMLKTNV